MLLSHKNIRLIRILLAVLVLTASSGATAVLNRCLMEEASCCCPNETSNHDGCGVPNALPSGHVFKSDFTCYTSVVVGGVALKQALLEKENRQESGKAVTFISPRSSGLLQSDTPSHTLIVSQSISPPSVDRYVLNASFLI